MIIAEISVEGVRSNAGFRALALRSDCRTPERQHFIAGTFFNRNRGHIRDGEVKRRSRRRYIEGDLVDIGQASQRLGTYFVGDVSVLSDAVCAHYDAVYHSPGDEVSCRAVNEDGDIDPVLQELPRREPGALR